MPSESIRAPKTSQVGLAIPKPQHRLKTGLIKNLDERQSRKKLEQKLDAVFSRYIRERDGWKCQIKGGCKHGGAIQCNHKITRANKRLRWDERNAVAGCQGHNKWAHHNPVEWSELWRKLWPEDATYLDIARQGKARTDIPTLQAQVTFFETKLKTLKLN